MDRMQHTIELLIAQLDAFIEHMKERRGDDVGSSA